MSDTNVDADVLQQIDAESRQLLDVIDNLRSLGVNSFVKLPQIVVVGNQSAGKSAVLEAISQVKFPSKSGVCTRFVTELVLRKAPEAKVEVSIAHWVQDGQSMREEKLKDLTTTSMSPSGFAAIMEAAHQRLGFSPKSNNFSRSILRVRIQGPERPQLTLVDLPGFYSSATEQQNVEGIRIVEELADKYMAHERSIILAVVSANTEAAQHKVLLKATEHDPTKERTLGIVNKPDTIEVNSDAEAECIRMIKNEDTVTSLKLGWHVLRNRSDNEAKAGTSSAQRDKTEAEFLSQGAWGRLPEANKGVAQLRSKLSAVLLNHIRRHLPEVVKGIEAIIQDRSQKLKALGTARTEPGQHRVYLAELAKHFENLSRDAIRGLYMDDAFFNPGGPQISELPNHQKLRARIRQLNRAFVTVMSVGGASRVVRMLDGTLAVKPEDNDPEYVKDAMDLYRAVSPPQVSWSDVKREIEVDTSADEGTEMPGTQNPWLAFRKFKEQARPWSSIADRHVELVIDITKAFVESLLEHVVADRHILERIDAQCVEPFFTQRRQLLTKKVQELLEPYRGDYAVAIDRDFISRLSARGARLTAGQGSPRPEVSIYGAETVANQMLTYYEMCLRTFTDNVVTLGAENCLIRHLPSIFDFATVGGMGDAEVSAMGAETAAVQAERQRLEKELQVLESGLQECKKFKPRTSNHLRSPLPTERTPMKLPSVRVESASRSPATTLQSPMYIFKEGNTLDSTPTRTRGATGRNNSTERARRLPSLSPSSSPKSTVVDPDEPSTPPATETFHDFPIATQGKLFPIVSRPITKTASDGHRARNRHHKTAEVEEEEL